MAADDIAALEGAARCASMLGDHRTAAEHWRAVIANDPRRSGARYSLAAALMQAGDAESAERELRSLIEIGAGGLQELNLLGVIQKRRGRIADAIETFRQATRVAPESHSPWYNLGNTLLGAGDAVGAVENLQRAVALQPKDSEINRVFGQALSVAGRHDEAMRAFDRAENLDPKNSRIHSSRATALQRANAPDAEVQSALERAITLAPDPIEMLRNKVGILLQRNRYDEAEATLREILRRNPEDVETLLRLAHLLSYTLRRYEEANDILRQARAINPDDPRTLSTLCKSLSDSRYGDEGEHLEEAGQVARQLLHVATDLRPHASNLSGVFLRLADFDGLDALGERSELMQYWVERMNVGALHNQLARVITRADRRELVHWHREWGRRVQRNAARNPIVPKPRVGKREKIRVGIMSSDLRDHPVAYFALPIFEHYNRSQFDLFCYSFYPAPPDNVQNFIQQRTAAFHSMLQASDREIAQRIADDGLDMLFELGGSTRYNRLEVLAYRAAPLQASWLGYPHSAGIENIDYILVDPYIKPDDKDLLIEKPFELPESWVCLGRVGFRDEVIEPGVPQDRSGVITFGTMNNPYKYTPAIFELWAECLRRIDGSRFLFVRPEAGAPTFCANVRRAFEANGVAGDRVDFHAVRGKHKPHYNRIDIALDTAPQTGGTTTCEALWMGVPTVTLVGEAFFERLSYSNLSNAGLGDLCAFTTDQYVETAVDLAQDRARRLDLRHGLRDRIRKGPLGDAKRWVRNFETEIRRVVGQA
jgi:protein O-GlcNAc transferase